MNNNLRDVIAQGQTQALEQLALQNKQLAGTITPEESTRLVLLTGSLTQLANQALALSGVTPEQAKGILAQGGIVQLPVPSASVESSDYDEDEDFFDDYDEDDYDEDDDEDLLELEDDNF